MKSLEALASFIMRKAWGVIFRIEESGSQKMKVLKHQRLSSEEGLERNFEGNGKPKKRS